MHICWINKWMTLKVIRKFLFVPKKWQFYPRGTNWRWCFIFHFCNYSYVAHVTMALRVLQNKNKLSLYYVFGEFTPELAVAVQCFPSIMLRAGYKQRTVRKRWEDKDSSKKTFTKRIFNDFILNPSKVLEHSDDIHLCLFVT